LRAGIAKGRSCASILFTPRRKTTLVRALHGRQPWPELERQGRRHGGAHRRWEIGRSGAGGVAAGSARGEGGPLLMESFQLLLLESSFFLSGQSVMKCMVLSHPKQSLDDLLLSLWNLCKARNFLTSRAVSTSRMISYYSSEAAAKEVKANSKSDETVVLLGKAS
jgi:hypothetical protein